MSPGNVNLAHIKPNGTSVSKTTAIKSLSIRQVFNQANTI